jgi:ABC-type amino acid transport system permease subunit
MNQKWKFLAKTPVEFSRRTWLLGALFIATLGVASYVDLTGLLEYFKIVRGAAAMTLETGATISIAADGYRNKIKPEQRG